MRLEQFVKNRNAFPADEFGRYTGQHVASSPDGTRILTSDPDPLRLLAAVRALGYDPAETPIEGFAGSSPVSEGFAGSSPVSGLRRLLDRQRCGVHGLRGQTD